MQCIDIGGIRNMAKKHMQLSKGDVVAVKYINLNEYMLVCIRLCCALLVYCYCCSCCRAARLAANFANFNLSSSSRVVLMCNQGNMTYFQISKLSYTYSKAHVPLIKTLVHFL